MKHFSPRFFAVILLLSSLVQKASSNVPDADLSCPLPAPQWITITGTTPTSISLSWQAIPGQIFTEYKVTTYNQTTQVGLADQTTTATSITIGGLTPGNTYTFGVSASSCAGGPYGVSIYITGRTAIIITGDLVQNCPVGAGQNRSAGQYDYIELTPANGQDQNVEAARVFVQKGSSTVDFIMWADCYYIPNIKENGTQNITRNPSGNDMYTTEIAYFINGNPFFTLGDPQFNNSYNITSVKITFNDNCSFQTCEGWVSCTSGNCCGGGSGGREAPSEHIIRTSAEDEPALTVAPNPASGEFQAEFDLPSESPVTFLLTDVTGHRVKTITLPGTIEAGRHVMSFRIEELPAGLYFLTLQTNAGHHVTTLVKQ